MLSFRPPGSAELRRSAVTGRASQAVTCNITLVSQGVLSLVDGGPATPWPAGGTWPQGAGAVVGDSHHRPLDVAEDGHGSSCPFPGAEHGQRPGHGLLCLAWGPGSGGKKQTPSQVFSLSGSRCFVFLVHTMCLSIWLLLPSELAATCWWLPSACGQPAASNLHHLKPTPPGQPPTAASAPYPRRRRRIGSGRWV
jgi:hypothetical protein